MLEALGVLRVRHGVQALGVTRAAGGHDLDVGLDALQLRAQVVTCARPRGELATELGAPGDQLLNPRGLRRIPARGLGLCEATVDVGDVEQEQLVGRACFHPSNLPRGLAAHGPGGRCACLIRRGSASPVHRAIRRRSVGIVASSCPDGGSDDPFRIHPHDRAERAA
nr:hypothetical protein [Microbacterium sp. JZ31]